jgi:hypothetical protein
MAGDMPGYAPAIKMRMTPGVAQIVTREIRMNPAMESKIA